MPKNLFCDLFEKMRVTKRENGDTWCKRHLWNETAICSLSPPWTQYSTNVRKTLLGIKIFQNYWNSFLCHAYALCIQHTVYVRCGSRTDFVQRPAVVMKLYSDQIRQEKSFWWKRRLGNNWSRVLDPPPKRIHRIDVKQKGNWLSRGIPPRIEFIRRKIAQNE